MSHTILIVDDSPIVRAVLQRTLTASGFDIVEAADGAEGAVAALRELPSMVITDLEMPVMDGFQLARLLKNDPATAHIPVIILTSHSEAASRYWGLDAGADEFLVKGELEERLLPTVRRIAAGIGPREGKRVPASTGALEVMARVARHLDRGLMEATLVNRVLEVGVARRSFTGAARSVLELLAGLVDAELLGLSLVDDRGLRVHLRQGARPLPERELEKVIQQLAEAVGGTAEAVESIQIDGGLRTERRDAELRCCFTSDLKLRDVNIEIAIFCDMVHGPEEVPRELLETTLPHVALVLENARLAERLWELSTHDGLTGLLNHRAIFARLEEEVQRAARYQQPVSVTLCDIDRFKSVNDRHGHQVGDAVLLEVAQRLQSGLRSCDIVGRYGGEEFLTIFPNSDLEGARIAAARLCDRLAATPVVKGDVAIPVTASFGVASGVEIAGEDCTEGLVSLADSRLYEAKAAGRCCVRP